MKPQPQTTAAPVSLPADPHKASVTVYDARGLDRISLRAWRVMFLEMWTSRELIHRLVLRNISGQFRQSLLGYLWIALPPLATTLIFALLKEARIVTVPMEDGRMPYPLFVLVGTTVWGLFTQVASMATTSIAGAGALVSKIYFPREVLVLSAVGNSLVNFLVRLVVVALTFALFMYPPHWQVILAPLYLLPLLAFALGLGLLLAPVNTMVNDTGRMLEFAFQFGMFLAPTVYPTPAIETATTKWEVALFWIHKLNPVSHTIYAVDNLIETGTCTPTPGYIASSVLGFLVLAIGWRFFHVCEPLLAERL